MMHRGIYVGLIHYPVTNRRGEVVSTSITNLDLHDIARIARTFGVKSCFIVHPSPVQQTIFERLSRFWKNPDARTYNPDRAEAFSLLNHVNTVEEAIRLIAIQEETDPVTVTTTARQKDSQQGLEAVMNLCRYKPLFLLFGTGNGLADAIHDRADAILESISGTDGYNHLSVRSAVAIYLSRIHEARYAIKSI